MTTTNKELIEKLTAYFLEQDPKAIARLLANSMIDLYRAFHLEDLPLDEKESLLFRMANNFDELSKFSKYGPSGPVIMSNFESGTKS